MLILTLRRKMVVQRKDDSEKNVLRTERRGMSIENKEDQYLESNGKR